MNHKSRLKLKSSKVLVVGAGGIGCELLKNLVLASVKEIHIVDLDTIEVSNLNRQFLFNRQHVGRPKAEVAAESVKAFNIGSEIKYYHSSIQDLSFDIEFFKQFDLIMNALDNTAARNHVNRMCLAADVPLIESGSAGYLGNVSVIKKELTECYECQPKPHQRTFPGCTIRNTPSEPIHCIVWSKHLFNQLFGEPDIDEDVSPDVADPELEGQRFTSVANGNASNGGSEESNSNGGNAQQANELQRVSTRKWAIENDYDVQKLFLKLFCDDIKYLLSMASLWKKRQSPEPLLWDENTSIEDENHASDVLDQGIWSISKCQRVFARSVNALKDRTTTLADGKVLVWDKDDDLAMDFVTACANLRAHCFHINLKSRFDIKTMAGNIIPAIATTNAVVAGLIVIEAMKVLSGHFEKCCSTFLVQKPNNIGKFIATSILYPPNPNCYVCSAKPEVVVRLDTKKLTIKSLSDKILKERLHMIAPDVELDNNSGTIIISSDEEETQALQGKTLSELNISDGTRLRCDDFLQQYELRLVIYHTEDLPHDVEFEVLNDITCLKGQPLEEAPASGAIQAESDEDITVVDESGVDIARKRKLHDLPEIDESEASKRLKAT